MHANSSNRQGVRLLKTAFAPLMKCLSRCRGTARADRQTSETREALEAAYARLERELSHLWDKPFVFKVGTILRTVALLKRNA